MGRESKTSQLQIRVSHEEKAAVQKLAKAANMGMSEWVLNKLLPGGAQRFHELLKQLKHSRDKSYVLAEIHDLFRKAMASEFEQMVAEPLPFHFPLYWENYLTAMVEYAAHQKMVAAPAWVQKIKPLDQPHFGSKLISLRTYLLTHSPPPFRRRNIFIDASIGQRV